MGRRPIGKRAMTDAERQRRHRQRTRKPILKCDTSGRALTKADMTALIATLAQQNAELRSSLEHRFGEHIALRTNVDALLEALARNSKPR